MSGWELSLIAHPQRDVDGAALSLISACTDQRQIAKLELPTARVAESFCVGDLFQIKKNRVDASALIGDLGFLHRVGFAWALRSLIVEGDVGMGLGEQMRSGSIEVRGSAASHAAQQLRGGIIRILGNTGDFLAAPLPGRRSGMSGGRVVVTGTAGHHAGHRMRRGVIAILGDCGDGVASDMVAGTIAIGGKVGGLVGAGMRRGTVILTDQAPLDAIRFVGSSPSPLGITRLVASDLQHDAPAIAGWLSLPVNRFLGDRSCGGQGEIWQARSDAAAR